MSSLAYIVLYKYCCFHVFDCSVYTQTDLEWEMGVPVLMKNKMINIGYPSLLFTQMCETKDDLVSNRDSYPVTER